jgi:hypothetical protein
MKSPVKIVLMPLGISMNKLALDLHLPAMRIQEIVHQRPRNLWVRPASPEVKFSASW